jgi:alginate O-acetyltransferase complex protein AlgJ
VANESDNPVGRDEPLKPAHSLPRYSEPTPETHRKVSREDEAEMALKNSAFIGPSRLILIVLFIVTVLSVPTVQFAYEKTRPQSDSRSETSSLYKAYPAWNKIRTVRGPRDLWRLLPRGAELKAAEKELETNSVVSEWLLPRVQLALVKLGAGNEQVYLGGDGWLFYRPDVDYVTGPPFLEPKVMTHRAHTAGVQPDPVKAIIAFRDQLAARGIDLVLVPVPTKASIEGERLSVRARTDELLANDSFPAFENESFSEFQRRLSAAGVRVFDPAPLLMDRKAGSNNLPQFLEKDTHWRPEAMEFVAGRLAWLIDSAEPNGSTGPLQISPAEISGRGDVARMLKLPPGNQKIDAPQRVPICQVSDRDNPWRPSPEADILLLGDSFANIFSLAGLGWGESAGLAEHLSIALGGRPLDCILRNSDAAFATREILSRELARGKDRLAGKKWVIWQFATRELAFGDWKMLEMKLGEPMPSRFFVPKTGEEVVVSGTIEAISTVPRPGTVPYQDHILALHLTDLTVEGGSANEGLESLVYLESMRDNIQTAAARLRPGDRVKLRLRAWTDVSDRYEKINRSEIDDPSVQLEEPCWGELISN